MAPLRGGFFCRGAGGSSKKYVMTGFFDGGGLRKCKPFLFLQCVFLQAVRVPCMAVFFVVGVGGLPESLSCQGGLCEAVCVSASRLFFCSVFFCKRCGALAWRFFLSCIGG